jgi:enterochelin esterase-like enzyme
VSRLAFAALVGLVAAAVAFATTACGAGSTSKKTADLLPSGWTKVQTDSAGGTVWRGAFDSPFGPSFTASFIYLPPKMSRRRRYPVLYVLHGFGGSPASIVNGLALGRTADRLIRRGLVRPFIMATPSGNGLKKYRGEWTGSREALITNSVVHWMDAHLPTIANRTGRAVGGLSAGAYGAVDITLRHPGLFATAESWSGYFRPIRDGTLKNATARQLAAHDPVKLVRNGAARLRTLGTRFFVSVGATDLAPARDSRAFARELNRLRLPHTLLILPGGHGGRLWRAQLPAALEYAFPSRTRRLATAAHRHG